MISEQEYYLNYLLEAIAYQTFGRMAAGLVYSVN